MVEEERIEELIVPARQRQMATMKFSILQFFSGPRAQKKVHGLARTAERKEAASMRGNEQDSGSSLRGPFGRRAPPVWGRWLALPYGMGCGASPIVREREKRVSARRAICSNSSGGVLWERF